MSPAPAPSTTEQNLQEKLAWLKARNVWWVHQIASRPMAPCNKTKEQVRDKKGRLIYNIRFTGEVISCREVVIDPSQPNKR